MSKFSTVAAIDDIRLLMKQHQELNKIKGDVLELTEIVDQGVDLHLSEKKALRVTKSQQGNDDLQKEVELYCKNWMLVNAPDLIRLVVERQINTAIKNL